MIHDIELLCQIQGLKTLKTNGIAFFVFFGDALAKSIERKNGHELIEKLACSSKKRATYTYNRVKRRETIFVRAVVLYVRKIKPAN